MDFLQLTELTLALRGLPPNGIGRKCEPSSVVWSILTRTSCWTTSTAVRRLRNVSLRCCTVHRCVGSPPGTAFALSWRNEC